MAFQGLVGCGLAWRLQRRASFAFALQCERSRIRRIEQAHALVVQAAGLDGRLDAAGEFVFGSTWVELFARHFGK